jgi:hypothetical protein
MNRLLLAVAAFMIAAIAGAQCPTCPWITYNAKVTISGTVDSSQTAVTLVPASANQLTRPETINNSIVLYLWNNTDYRTYSQDPNAEAVSLTATSSNAVTLTVVRGVGGYSAVAHNISGKTYVLQEFGYTFIPFTPTPTNTATLTSTKTPTKTPTNTATATITNTPLNTATKTPTATITNTPTNTRTYTPTSTPTATVTPTPTPIGGSVTNIPGYHAPNTNNLFDSTLFYNPNTGIVASSQNQNLGLAVPAGNTFEIDVDDPSAPSTLFANVGGIEWENSNSSEFVANPTNVFWSDGLGSSFTASNSEVFAEGTSSPFTLNVNNGEIYWNNGTGTVEGANSELYWSNGSSFMEAAPTEFVWFDTADSTNFQVTSTELFWGNGTAEFFAEPTSMEWSDGVGTTFSVGSMNVNCAGSTIVGAADPTNAQDGATKNYVYTHSGDIQAGSVTFTNSLTTPVTVVATGFSSSSKVTMSERGTAVAASFGWTSPGPNTIVFNGTLAGAATITWIGMP